MSGYRSNSSGGAADRAQPGRRRARRAGGGRLLHDSLPRSAAILAGLSAAWATWGMAGMDHSAMESGSMAEMQPHLNESSSMPTRNDRTLGDPKPSASRPVDGAAAHHQCRVLHQLLARSCALSGELIASTATPSRRWPAAASPRHRAACGYRLQLPAGAGAYPILRCARATRRATGIILATAGAAVARIPDHAEMPTAHSIWRWSGADGCR